ncbi:MAG TPA: J domain-containing protein [Myxococcaceae bacterium]|nr:J domain-containing protein [Myxococcaceae bacterium]
MAPTSDSGSGRPKSGAGRPPPAPSPSRPLDESEIPTPPHGAPVPRVAPAVPTPPRTAAPTAPPKAVQGRPAAPPRPPPVLHTPSKGNPAAPKAAIVPPAPPAAPRAAAIVPPPPPAAAPLDPAQLQELEQRFTGLDKMDYFQLLKLQPTATPPEIKAAFYRESRTLHPDKFFQMQDKPFKEKVGAVYKRLTEAYYVLRDDNKRKRYAQDIASPERNAKLRFTEAAETETKQQVKKEQEEQIGVHPKGRQFYATAIKDLDGGNFASAERNFKMALTFEPSNARYKEKLVEAQQKLHDEQKKQGHSFKIR